MFRDLCSCHKNKKNRADDDDLPYSPKKKSSFFSFKRNNVVDKALTSTPNQLIQVRKTSGSDNYSMDMKNNNKTIPTNNLSKNHNLMDQPTNVNTMNHTSTNHSAMNNSHLTTSPIERDPNNHLNLNSTDELYRSDMSRSPVENDLNEMNNKFSNLWSNTNECKYSNINNSNQNVLNPKCDSPLSDNNLMKNNSTANLSNHSFQPQSYDNGPICKFRDNRSTNDLNSLESNALGRPKSFTDSTDNMLNSNKLDMNGPDLDKNVHTNGNILNLLHLNKSNLALANNDYKEKENTSISHLNEEKDVKSGLNDCNPISNLINIPNTTKTLKRVSSDDKISLDNSSIDSMVVDKQTNEIMRRSTKNQFEDDISTQVLHPNSIIIQETLTLTLKRDKNDKKSLNEFSIENLPKQILETSSFVKEYFYGDPVIKTSSQFMEPDLATYRMQSDPRGLCLIINNATVPQNCLRLKNGFTKEVNYFKDVFSNLGFNVEIHNNVNAGAMCKLMKNLKGRINSNHDAFICAYFGHGNQSYVIGEDNYKLNLELMIGCMNNYHCPNLINKPKIFFIHTCNSTCQTFLEPIAPSNIPREVQALKKISNFKIIPTWTDTVIIYSPFSNSNSLHYSPFVKEMGLVLCNDTFELSLHEILLKANDQILTKPQYEGQYGIDINYRGFNKSLYFNPGHYC